MTEAERVQHRARSSHLVPPTTSGPEMLRPAPATSSHLGPQQEVGNQAAQRFAQSCPLRLPSPGACPFGGVCHACPARVQAKLTVNRPGDEYEEEADRVAEQVMRMSEPDLQRQVEPEEEEEEEPVQAKPLADEITSLMQRQEEEREEEEEEETPQAVLAEDPQVQRQEEEPEEEEEEPVQAKSVSDAQFQRQAEEPEETEDEPLQTKGAKRQALRAGFGPEAQIRSLKGSGRPLSQSERSFFESRFGYDLRSVRLHTGTRAAKAAATVNARALTVGQGVVFGAGQYVPGTAEGKRLLAHELTHTIQQNKEGRRAVQRAFDIPAAIRYNESALGGNPPLLIRIKEVLNRVTGSTLGRTGTINSAFVLAVERYQAIKRLRKRDGKVGSRTRRELARDYRAIIPGTGGAAAPRALRAARNIVDIYFRENILFDAWDMDCRDNNKNNRVDAQDRSERHTSQGGYSWDGKHFGRTYRGFKTLPGTCRGFTTRAFETNAPVKYRVCADVVSLAYRQAGVLSSTTRSVASIWRRFRGSRRSTCWQYGRPNFPSTYLPGDFICSLTASRRHGHAGMVVRAEPTNSGSTRPFVVHLPGPSIQISRGLYDPTRTSDLRMERWPAARALDFLCRP